MKAIFLLPFIILLVLCSCSKKNFETKLSLKPLPISTALAVNESRALKDYADKLHKIDSEKIVSMLESKKEKEQFKHRIVDLKVSYNKCVDKLYEVEKASPNDKEERIRELKEYMAELDAIWKYLIVNYKI